MFSLRNSSIWRSVSSSTDWIRAREDGRVDAIVESRGWCGLAGGARWPHEGKDPISVREETSRQGQDAPSMSAETEEESECRDVIRFVRAGSRALARLLLARGS